VQKRVARLVGLLLDFGARQEVFNAGVAVGSDFGGPLSETVSAPFAMLPVTVRHMRFVGDVLITVLMPALVGADAHVLEIDLDHFACRADVDLFPDVHMRH
jgi:hypothetical protein